MGFYLRERYIYLCLILLLARWQSRQLHTIVESNCPETDNIGLNPLYGTLLGVITI
jgi:hypothetical protein